MSRTNTNDIQDLYRRALRHQADGQFEEALRAYDAIIRIRPDIAEVHFQVGRIFLEKSRFARAAIHLEAAMKIKPDETAVWRPYARALVCLGDGKKTADALRALGSAGLPRAAAREISTLLKRRQVRSRVATGNAGTREVERVVSLARSGKLAEAEAEAGQLARRYGNVALFANTLGTVQHRRKRIPEARASFERSLGIDETYAEAHNNLGRLLLESGESSAAGSHLQRALELTPLSPSVLTNMGLLVHQEGQTSDAERFFRRAVKSDPKFGEAFFALGRLFLERGDFANALVEFRKARVLGCDGPELLMSLGRAEELADNFSAAADCYDRVLKLDPDHALACNRRAVLCQQQGDFATAEELFRKAISLEPGRGEHYRLFSASHRFGTDDPLIPDMVRRFESADTDPADKVELGFALSKAMEDCARTEDVFRFLNAANALTRELHPYDIGDRIAEVRNVMEFFRHFDGSLPRIAGCTDFAPIFVTGLPRSGTTLVEQILSSHSSVTGAGELGEFSREAARLTINSGSYKSLADIGESDLRRLGKTYRKIILKRFPGAQRVTDKSIQTFLFAGLARLAMPNSRIVLVKRNPRDNLYSIYKNRFPHGTHLYSYDFEDTAEYFRQSLLVEEFWRERMPDGLCEISYDELIRDPEAQTRALLDACGLAWEDSCLEFHRNDRAVKTLSLFQVRQPIYASSVNSWKKYENDLRPLFDKLDLA